MGVELLPEKAKAPYFFVSGKLRRTGHKKEPPQMRVHPGSKPACFRSIYTPVINVSKRCGRSLSLY